MPGRLIWCNNEGERQTCYKLGCVLSHPSKVLKRPNTTVSVHNVPLMMPLSVVNLPANDCDLLRNWASAYGVAVRQRTVWQETTMARHGTLPEYLYQRRLEVGDKVNLNFGVNEDEGPHEDLNKHDVSEEASDSDEGQQEFDESSDEEVEVSADDNNS